MSRPQNWLDFLDTANREMMRRSEWKLGGAGAVVDFGNFQYFHDRFATLSSSLEEAFHQLPLPLVATGFFTLPYLDSQEKKVSSSLLTWTRADPDLVEVSHPGRSTELEEFRRGCSKFKTYSEGLVATTNCTLVQFPYFIKPSPPGISLESFEAEKVIFDVPVFSRLDQLNLDWIKDHSRPSYVQRFIVLAVFDAPLSRAQEVLEETTIFRNLLGSFLSWAGLDTDSFHHFESQRFAAMQILRAHELGNHLKGLYGFFGKNFEAIQATRGKPSGEDVASLRKIFLDYRSMLDAIQRAVDDFATVVDERHHGSLWLNALRETLVDESFKAETTDGGGTYSFVKDGHRVEIDLKSISTSAKCASVLYPSHLFKKLTSNLLHNAIRAYRRWPKRGACQRVRVSATVHRDHLDFVFANEGPPIPRGLKRGLFRVPMRQNSTGEGTGVGLYALGLTFKSYGIAPPRLHTEPGFGPVFTFRFPLAARGRGK